MRKLVNLLLCVLILSFSAGCGKSDVLSWQDLYDTGVRYLEDGKFDEAILAFQAAIQIDPKKAESYLGLEEVYMVQGDEDSAKKILSDALAAVDDSSVIQARLDELESPKQEQLPDTGQEQPEPEPVQIPGAVPIEGTDLVWALNNGVLTIAGNGPIPDYSQNPDTGNTSAPWGESTRTITGVDIRDGITSIGNYSFHSFISLSNISIPDSVTSIGSFAFEFCDSLTDVAIPDGVTFIGESAFGGCDFIQNINIPASLTSIENYAFSGCESITSVSIPDGVTSIGDNAFSVCVTLHDVTIPDSVTSIGEYAFYWSPVHNIRIPNGITTIRKGTFSYCGLSTLTIPDTVTTIEDSAFLGCPLSSLTIPDSVTYIGASAFSVCENLTSLTIPASVTYIGEDALNLSAYPSETIPHCDIYYGGTEAQWQALSAAANVSENVTVHCNA